jgi:hypothetical protein
MGRDDHNSVRGVVGEISSRSNSSPSPSGEPVHIGNHRIETGGFQLLARLRQTPASTW